eukprot:1181008-Prorocentrum_minimum.AAC.2
MSATPFAFNGRCPHVGRTHLPAPLGLHRGADGADLRHVFGRGLQVVGTDRAEHLHPHAPPAHIRAPINLSRPPPSSDWSKLRVYAPSPHPIGPSCEYMLLPSSDWSKLRAYAPPLIRLVQAAIICSLPTFDWSEL